MNKSYFIFIALLLFSFSADKQYPDGEYFGTSRAGYTDEPYYGHVALTIRNGEIVKVNFCIRDSAKHEYLDNQYERHFAGNDLYIQQCRNDVKGLRSYPDSLLKCQDISKVDAITGATWSFNIFKASVPCDGFPPEFFLPVIYSALGA